MRSETKDPRPFRHKGKKIEQTKLNAGVHTNDDSKNTEIGNQLLHGPSVKPLAHLSHLVTVGCQDIQDEKEKSRAKGEGDEGRCADNTRWNGELGRRRWQDG
jgi:hypothetical protein